MVVEEVFAVVAVASAVAGAAASYMSSTAQAAASQRAAQQNMVMAQLQAEMAHTQRAALATQVNQTALETLQQENERRRRLEQGEGSNRALAAFAGFDAENSGSYQSLAAENRRIAEQDISNIHLLGGARAMQLTGQEYASAVQEAGYRSRAVFADMERQAAATMGDWAWVAPAGRLLNAGVSIYKAAG